MSNYQLLKGYKQTEVGVIPEDWEVLALGDLGTWKGGATPLMANPEYWLNGYIPWASSGDIKVTLLGETELQITDAATKNTSVALLPKNSIILVTRSGILRKYLPVAKTIVPLAINQDIKGLIPNSTVDPDFLLQSLLISGPKILSECQKSGTTVESIDFGWLKAFRILVPSDKEEQRAIATTLSDVDALIAALDKLIAKKRHLKTATMQQLLTGKKRLPGFCDKWEIYTILDVCRNIIDYRGRTPRKLGMEWGDGDIPTLSANNVKMGFIDFKAEAYLGSEDLYSKWMKNGDPQKGDIALTMEAPLGNVALIPDEKRYILSQRVILLQTHKEKVFNDFLAQLMMSSKFQSLLSQDSSGSTATGIQRKKLEKISFNVPELDEQRAIAAILSDMDADIAALETRRTKTQAIKQGMMQQLLTGKVRLV
jgi:type I restriction enzyme S subunit